MSLVSGETAYISTEQLGSIRRRVCANTFSLQCVTISFYFVTGRYDRRDIENSLIIARQRGAMVKLTQLYRSVSFVENRFFGMYQLPIVLIEHF